jgi:hypothetical protein
VETERPEQHDRDDDLVALEGLEAELTELEAELARVEQSRTPRADGPEAASRGDEGPAEHSQP